MPITNISKVQSKVFGICCLEETEKEKVKSLWDSRFSERTAFWIEATLQNTCEDLRQAIANKIIEQHIQTMAGEQCILTVFMDLCKPVAPEFMNTLWGVCGALRASLNCNIAAVLQFGYVGIQGVGSKEVQRANTRLVVDKNSSMPAVIQHRLCLVGNDSLRADSGMNWKAAIVYLDTLRRVSAPANLLPLTADGIANNDVGFLRYGEYDKVKYDRLVAEQKRLDTLKGKNGGEKLKEQLDKKRNEILSQVDSRFVIRGSLHPQHPDMEVGDSTFDVKRKKAVKGTNKEYAEAQRETRSAVILTGNRMKKEIISLFEPEIDAASRILEEILDQAQVGVELKSDKSTMQAYFIGNGRRVSEPQPPKLEYRREGCADEINSYLADVKAHAIDAGMSKFNAALNAAYERILEKGFESELQDIQDSSEVITEKVNRMGTAEKFFNKIAFLANPPMSDFNPAAAPGTGMKYLLFRGTDMGNIAANVANNTAMPIYEIQVNGGGIQKLDNAPLKAVQIVFLDCSDATLLQLMPEVTQ